MAGLLTGVTGGPETLVHEARSDGTARDGARQTTFREARGGRLQKPVLARDLLTDFESITGEIAKTGELPTWAEYVVAKMAHRAATSASRTRDVRQMEETNEREPNVGAGRNAFLLRTEGLPRTNAVTGVKPEEDKRADGGWGA